MMLKTLASAVLLGAALFEGAFAERSFGQKVRDRNHQRANRAVASVQETGNLEERASSMRYLNKKTKPYQVTSLPEVSYDLGEMYSGLVPINNGSDDRELFFIFKPRIGPAVDEVTIWLNGGPGCSSLEGFIQENGPFIWQPGTFAPIPNPYSWANLTNMLYVEQPVGTGFTKGTPVATSQEETAAEFVKFFKNWQEIFGIKNYKIYVTGESYAGRYVPYISAAMLDQKNKTYFDLNGALVYDPCIGSFDFVQEELYAVPFVQQNANLFNFNKTFMAQLEKLHQSCGYADYIDKYFQFPPAGMQPAEYFNYSSPKNLSCDVFDLINEVALGVNPCFDIYEVNTMCPLPWDILGFPTEIFDYAGDPQGAYFNRSDVKKALHAPMDVDWTLCSLNDPYKADGSSGGPESEGDLSLDPIQHVLPQVIEATNRVLVGNGDYDMIIITNGTLLSIQNMTWNGKMGFQSMPSQPIVITMPDLVYNSVYDNNNLNPGYAGLDGPQGVMGVQHYERGLMWVETYQSGHMQPEYQPRVSWRHLEWLLGRTDSI